MNKRFSEKSQSKDPKGNKEHKKKRKAETQDRDEQMEAGNVDCKEDDPVWTAIAKDPIEEEKQGVMKEVVKHKENRIIFMNLAWTSLVANAA